MGGFLASEWIRRGSDLANRSFGAVVALEECKGLGNAGYDFRRDLWNGFGAQSCLPWKARTPQCHWTHYKMWGKAAVKQIILCNRRWECPGSAAAIRRPLGMKEFCIFRVLGGLRRCGYFWISLFQSSTLPQLRCCLGWLEQSPAWLVRAEVCSDQKLQETWI